jgi:hypothetical protein
MDEDVKILTLPSVNWQGLIDLVQENLGVSPTRVLDAEKIDIKEPRAVLRALENLTTKPKTCMYNPVRDHLHCSFIAKCDQATTNIIIQTTPLKAFSVGVGKLSIFTGSLNDWYLAIYAGCVSSVPHDVRRVLNSCFFLFINYSLNLWPNATRRKHKDGTLIIEAFK